MSWALAALREAMRRNDAETLRAALQGCATYEPLQDPEVRDAEETLQSVDSYGGQIVFGHQLHTHTQSGFYILGGICVPVSIYMNCTWLLFKLATYSLSE